MDLSLGCSSNEASPSITHSPSSNYEETRLSRQMDRGSLRMATICEEDEQEEETNPCQDGVCIVGKNGEISRSTRPTKQPLSDKKPTKTTPSGRLSQPTLTPKPAMLLVSSRESPKALLASLNHQPSRVSSPTSSQQRDSAVVESMSRTYTRSSGGRSNRQTTTSSSCTTRSCSCSRTCVHTYINTYVSSKTGICSNTFYAVVKHESFT